MNQRVVVTGCSSGGKSSLVAALQRAGHAVVAEPGRRIVEAEIDPASARLPWNDALTFARAARDLALADHRAAQGRPLTFFDRGLVDALVGEAHALGRPLDVGTARAHRYHRTVFMAPPWPEIYVQDQARRHSFDEAAAEYRRLAAAYPALGYQVVELPRVAVAQRVAFVLATLKAR